tara:strand:+ start:2144 stop:2683 length:540 start_codon:yes stop_codon:yes gene_type:complete
MEGLVSPSDLAALGQASSETSAGNVLPSQMRDRHHTIARMLALGFKQTQIAAVTGMSGSRISVIKKAPAFIELLTFYQEESGAEFRDLTERFKHLGMEITGELLGRLEAEPEAISTGELRELLKTVADRSGYSPVQKSITLSASIDPEQMERLKDAARTQETIRTVGSQSSDGILGPGD